MAMIAIRTGDVLLLTMIEHSVGGIKITIRRIELSGCEFGIYLEIGTFI